MAKIFYIQASPRIGRSHSIAVADAFIEAYKTRNPGDEIKTANLFTMDLPAFDGLVVQAKYSIMHGKKHSPQEAAAWKRVEELIEEFKGADKYVMAVPMWNFMIPYRLKQYLDIIVQPTYTFSVTKEGAYQGLVTGKPVFIAFARGGAYPQGSPMEALDHQSKYLKFILGFIGLTDIRHVMVEPMLAGPEHAEEAKKKAIEKARDLAASF